MGRRERFTILLSAAGRRVHLLEAFREALRRAGIDGRVVAADASRASAAFHAADAAFLVPRCDDEAFVPAMLDLCRDEQVGLVVPTIDTELAAWANHRREFAEHGTTVAVSSPETVAIGADKALTHRWLLDNGFPTVRQADAGTVRETPGEWPPPLVVKPRFGSASKGVSVVRDADELELRLREPDVVVQSVAQGAEHTVDVYVDRSGRCRCAVPRRRVEVRAGEVSKGVTVRHRAIGEVAARLAEALPGAWGALTLQVFAEGDELEVIELNARFGGGFPLSWRAGADFPLWLLTEARGHELDDVGDAWRDGLAMLRYDDAVFVDAADAGLA